MAWNPFKAIGNFVRGLFKGEQQLPPPVREEPKREERIQHVSPPHKTRERLSGEIFIGNPNISRDDDIDFLASPTWRDVLDIIQDNDIAGPIDLLVIGAIYRNSDQIGGATQHFLNTQDLFKAVDQGQDPSDSQDTVNIVERVFGFRQGDIQKIAGFVIRTLD